jgi:hypothetical protein
MEAAAKRDSIVTHVEQERAEPREASGACIVDLPDRDVGDDERPVADRRQRLRAFEAGANCR